MTIYVLSGSQTFSTADAKVPVTIEADPKVVNLYFVIVNRDKYGVEHTEIKKVNNPQYEQPKQREVKKTRKPQFKQNPNKKPQYNSHKTRKRPSFPYHAVANKLPPTTHSNNSKPHKPIKLLK